MRTFFSTFRSKNFLIVCPRGCFLDCVMGRCAVQPCQSVVSCKVKVRALASQLNDAIVYLSHDPESLRQAMMLDATSMLSMHFMDFLLLLRASGLVPAVPTEHHSIVDACCSTRCSRKTFLHDLPGRRCCPMRNRSCRTAFETWPPNLARSNAD